MFLFFFLFTSEGVRGRNSENTLIKKHLGWAPGIALADGFDRTYTWINDQVQKAYKEEGEDVDFSKSQVVQQSTEVLDGFTN